MKKWILFVSVISIFVFGMCGCASNQQTLHIENNGPKAVKTVQATIEPTKQSEKMTPSPDMDISARTTNKTKPKAGPSSKKTADPKPTQKLDFATIEIVDSTSGTIIMDSNKVKLLKDQSVMDALKAICRQKGIVVDSANGYVKGINDLYEFDKGASSGWVYSVNEIYPSISSAQYTVKSGDKIKWEYTTKG